MEAIVLLGAPGAGKGTVAGLIEEQTSFSHVSTGDILRAAVKEGHPLGCKARKDMEAGQLVSDDVIVGLVNELLDAGPPDACYMFDGFPRTLEQARKLDEALARKATQLRSVFLLEVPRELVVARLGGRRICRDCGAVYHVSNIPPQVEGVCDDCGGELYQRPDDAEATVLNRLAVFKEQTAVLIKYYESRGVLVRVDGACSRDETAAEIMASLGRTFQAQ